MRKNSVKNTRINAEVMRELSVAIRDLKDPRISPMVSVTGADVFNTTFASSSDTLTSSLYAFMDSLIRLSSSIYASVDVISSSCI